MNPNPILNSMKEALYYNKLPEKKVKCLLCPHNCLIKEGTRGICGVRINQNGILYSEVYGRPVAMNIDPVEKKPLYHFYPGQQVLSIGTLGCNLKCSFCQNSEISQLTGNDQSLSVERSLDEIILPAMQKQKNIGLAYTYNEPVIFYEYMSDLAREIHKRGMKNVMISNGFINPEPLSQLLGLIDAFNIDLKSFEDDFYKKQTKSRLGPVLETIKTIYNNGNHLELTFLVIPGLNDDMDVFDAMLDWIIKYTSKRTVLHISRYFPHYQMNRPPTPFKTIENLYYHAKKKLDFVYPGNTPETKAQDTYCQVCKTLLLKRSGYYTKNEGLDSNGECIKCHEKVINYISL
jgi:pyruvate formate lyase activating enzyme